MRWVSAQTSASRRSGERPSRGRRAEIAHLVLERRVGAGVAHAALPVEGRDRLGAGVLAARRDDRRHRHARVDEAQHRRDHVAALVDLGDEGVGLKRAGRARRRCAAQASGCDAGDGLVGDDVAHAAASIPAAMMPQAEARLPADAGGSTATTMRRSAGAAATRAASIASRFHSASARSSISSPSSSWRPSRRAAVARAHLRQERRREVSRVRGGAGPRQPRRRGRRSADGSAGSAAASWSRPGAAGGPSRRPNCSMSQVSCA